MARAPRTPGSGATAAIATPGTRSTGTRNGDWYGGDLSDSLWVHQVSTPYFTVAGSCDGAYVTVSEYIKENDPVVLRRSDGDAVGLGAGLQRLRQQPGPGLGRELQRRLAERRLPLLRHLRGDDLGRLRLLDLFPPRRRSVDPQAEQDCYAMGWNWQPWDCNCVDPCQPDPYCTDWNFQTCTASTLLNCPNPPAGADSGRALHLSVPSPTSGP